MLSFNNFENTFLSSQNTGGNITKGLASNKGRAIKPCPKDMIGIILKTSVAITPIDSHTKK